METKFRYQPAQPYGLNDMRICSINIINGNIDLLFENGFIKIEEPYRKVNGTMTVERIDPDFSDVFLLGKNGKYGPFRGEKLALTDFVKRFPDFNFEVVDELYGYNKILYGGFVSLPEFNYMIEMKLIIYYEGNIIYNTDEN